MQNWTSECTKYLLLGSDGQPKGEKMHKQVDNLTSAQILSNSEATSRMAKCPCDFGQIQDLIREGMLLTNLFSCMTKNYLRSDREINRIGRNLKRRDFDRLHFWSHEILCSDVTAASLHVTEIPHDACLCHYNHPKRILCKLEPFTNSVFVLVTEANICSC